MDGWMNEWMKLVTVEVKMKSIKMQSTPPTRAMIFATFKNLKFKYFILRNNIDRQENKVEMRGKGKSYLVCKRM